MNIDAKLLSRFYPLDSLTDMQRQELAEASVCMKLANKKALFSKGDADDRCYYLVSGELLAEYPNGREKTIQADTEESRYAIGNLIPRQFTARAAKKDTKVFSLDQHLLEKFVTWSQMSRDDNDGLTVVDLGEPEETGTGPSSDWMFKMLQTRVFQDMPTENIESFFSSVEQIDVTAGDRIIQQGDEGDYYYMIKSGEAGIVRQAGQIEFPITTISDGDSFGEEALVTNQPRNASVTMLTDGVLMRLAKKSFAELLKRPTISYTTVKQALESYRQDEVTIIDLRHAAEYGRRSLKGSINIPLFRLRQELGMLKPDRKYILCCNSGVQSATGAFIMGQRGFDVSALEGGLNSIGASKETGELS